MEGLEISEVARTMNIKPHTLRYYESIGLIQGVHRNDSRKRIYSEKDIEWIRFLNRLRATGMNIRKMTEYARLRHLGDETVPERRRMMEEHLASIDMEIQKLMEARAFVEKKIDIYKQMEEELHEQQE
ncbi:MAG TPA: MerR family transcriptional regulator [Lachnospiraceae bacterium]|nr:MerR family transcriptional regulator [Lachnospiraceae bacterium]